MAFLKDNQYEGYYPQQSSTPQGSSSSKEIFTQGMVRQLDQQQVQFILGNEDVVEQAQFFLRGISFDEKEQKWRQMSKPLMNEEGVNFTIQQIRLLTDKMFQLTEITPPEHRAICSRYNRVLAMSLYENRIRFEIDRKNIPQIHNYLLTCVIMTLKKSQGGNMQKFLKDSFKTIETIQPQKSGFNIGGLLFGRGKNG